MPLTPFIGLSVIVHLIIILINKISSWFPKSKKVRFKSILGTKLKSISIIIIIFSFVTIQAGILLHASIVDKHSSLKYIPKYAAIINKFIINEKPKIIALSKIGENKIQIPENPIVDILRRTEPSSTFLYEIAKERTP